jgi:predicted nucleic acid-binding protein
MDLFIDTNIFLSFYLLTSEDLEELQKLSVLLRNNEIRLWLPQQVVDEFWRNREAKIAEAIKQLKDQRLSLQFPALCKDFYEYEELRQLQRQYEQTHKTLIAKILEDVEQGDLKADYTIRTLLSNGTKIHVTEQIVSLAQYRYNIGNPPGKNGSLGDAINWECLLAAVPNNTTLYFVTGDKDYYSPIDEKAFNSFLLEEWEMKKNGEIVYFRKISEFFRQKYPDIKLASQLEKDFLIRDLANSSSFLRTHVVVAKLQRQTDFTASQINEIISACLDNDQVALIINDADIKEFIDKITTNNEDRIEADNLKRLKKLMEGQPSNESEAEDAT